MHHHCVWRKSSYSDATGNSECVEVSFTDAVHVRDSKNVAGATLSFSASAWHAFVRADRAS